MKRYLIAGIVLFFGFAIAFAPAGLVDRGVESVPGIDLVDTRGTVWNGQAQMLLEGQPLGVVNWQFQPLSVLRAAPGYAWQLNRVDMQLTGTAAANPSAVALDLRGGLAAAAFNDWLRTYDIRVSGDLEIMDISATVAHGSRVPERLEGQINWSGGNVLYTLSGLVREVQMPPLTAYLDIDEAGLPEAVVYTPGDDTPLIIARVGTDGFAKIGITKLFTKLVQNPYPGSDPDHAIVLEVEEQIF